VYGKLPEKRFYRAHRSYVVNLDCVVGAEKYHFIMCNGDKVSIAKNRYAEAKKAYSEYYGDKGEEIDT
jgi:DNA-binding LytR/AlgR family response regulator